MKAKDVLIFDVDGVMTDGSVTYDENGVEYKTFNVKDGQGLVRMGKSGFITAIITARNNGTVKHRAENLNITEIYQGQKYKLPALEEIMAKYGLTYENVAYMGDDIPDICVLEKVALACCPNDAVDEVRAVCNFISSNSTQVELMVDENMINKIKLRHFLGTPKYKSKAIGKKNRMVVGITDNGFAKKIKEIR